MAVADDDWLEAGRTDIYLFAERGFGIKLHPKQVEVVEVEERGDVQHILLTWANRAGKTTTVFIAHAHRIFYKVNVRPAEDEADYRKRWLPLNYRTLYCAPLNSLSGKAFEAWQEILSGTSPAQEIWDDDGPTGRFRDGELLGMFGLTRERLADNTERMFLRCLTGGITDFYTTEGRAGRLATGAWRFESWDEWPQQENPDNIRPMLTKLENRASDFDAPILLTGTLTEEAEHIGREWLANCEDPENLDWWGSTAQRSDNPMHRGRALERAKRNMDKEDYDRTVLGIPGGAKGRVLPAALLDPVFTRDLEDETPAHPNDGFRKTTQPSPWTYVHAWDIAIAAADVVGTVFRVPADWRFGMAVAPKPGWAPEFRPIDGVYKQIIPGSTTLTTGTIKGAIERVFLQYGGVIVIDTTDAYGKSIARDLKAAGYPVIEFDFHSRPKLKVPNGRPLPIRKDQAVIHLRRLLCEGESPILDTAGVVELDADNVPGWDRDKPFGVLRMPASWRKHHDQLSVLRPDDERQRKDCAMSVLMGADICYRERRGIARPSTIQPFNPLVSGRSFVTAR